MENTPHSAAMQDPSTRAPLVLIVEDEPAVLDILAEYFEGQGMRVTTASEGWQAVVQAEGMKIDLVVCDVMMPGPKGSGVDAYHGLRDSRFVRRDLPIIFVTAMPLDQVRKALPEDPRMRLFSKPVDFPRLREAVRELLGR